MHKKRSVMGKVDKNAQPTDAKQPHDKESWSALIASDTKMRAIGGKNMQCSQITTMRRECLDNKLYLRLF